MTGPEDQDNRQGGSNPFDPKTSSVPLEGGGDTHLHPHADGTGSTVTTRLPGDVTIHDEFDSDGNYIGGGFD